MNVLRVGNSLPILMPINYSTRHRHIFIQFYFPTRDVKVSVCTAILENFVNEKINIRHRSLVQH